MPLCHGRVCTRQCSRHGCIASCILLHFLSHILSLPVSFFLCLSLFPCVCTFAYQFASFVHLKLRSICSFCKFGCILFSALESRAECALFGRAFYCVCACVLVQEIAAALGFSFAYCQAYFGDLFIGRHCAQ